MNEDSEVGIPPNSTQILIQDPVSHKKFMAASLFLFSVDRKLMWVFIFQIFLSPLENIPFQDLGLLEIEKNSSCF